MKNIFINDINLLFKITVFNLKKSFFYTNNPAVYKFLKIKKFNVCLISEFIGTKKLIKLQSIYFKKFHHLLYRLDKEKILKKFFLKKNQNLFYNSFRYIYAINYSGIKISVDALNKIIKKKKIKTIYFVGEIGNEFFDRSILLDELKKNNSKLKIINSYNPQPQKKNLFNKINLRSFNSLNLDILNNYFKKIISKKLFFCNKKKNLVIEPLWDLFYYNYNLKKNLIINLSDIIRKNFEDRNKKFDQKNLTKLIEFIFKKNNNYFSKKILKKLIIKADEINQKSNFLIDHINKLLKKFNFKNIVWCVDPDSYTANIINFFKNKKIQIIGIQHGGGYLLQNYESLHLHSDFNFCDKFLSYGSSNHLMNKKIYNVGCFRDKFYKKNSESKNTLNTTYEIMYIPNPIVSDAFYVLNSSSHEKILLQDKIVDYLKNISSKTIIKLPQNPNLNHYPLLVDTKNMNNFFLRYEKIYKSLTIYRPKIIVLDYFSTSIYECLYSRSEIILFLDKWNMPKYDVIKSLKKRVHIIYKFSELGILVNKILNNKIKKQSNEFMKKFFKIKNTKIINTLLNN